MPSDLLSMAEESLLSRDIDAAERLYRHAVELEPGNARAHCGLGRVLMKLQRFDEALAEFRIALSMDPARGDAHFGLGTIFGIREQYAESLAELSRAIEIDPQNADAYMNLGITYRMQGRLDQAIKVGTMAFRLAPSFKTMAPIIYAAWRGMGRGVIFVILMVVTLNAFVGNSIFDILIMTAWVAFLQWTAVLAFRAKDTRKGMKFAFGGLLLAILYMLKRTVMKN